jgi:hypothetical protein
MARKILGGVVFTPPPCPAVIPGRAAAGLRGCPRFRLFSATHPRFHDAEKTRFSTVFDVFRVLDAGRRKKMAKTGRFGPFLRGMGAANLHGRLSVSNRFRRIEKRAARHKIQPLEPVLVMKKSFPFVLIGRLGGPGRLRHVRQRKNGVADAGVYFANHRRGQDHPRRVAHGARRGVEGRPDRRRQRRLDVHARATPKAVNFLPVARWFASGADVKTKDLAVLFDKSGTVGKYAMREV